MILVPIFFLGFFGFWIASMAFWIIKIIEVAKIPDQQYRAAGTEKVVWVLVVALAGVIGALIWQFAKRNEVLAATGALSIPPGWYPEPGSAAMRWWDGAQWTEHRHVPPPPA